MSQIWKLSQQKENKMIQLTKEDVNKAMNEYMLCDTVRGNEKLAEIFNQLLASKQQPQEQPPKKKVVEWEYDMQIGDGKYYTANPGFVAEYDWEDEETDYHCYKTGNYFQTEEEAKAKKEYDLLFADYCELIRQTNSKTGLVLNWGCGKQIKHCLSFNFYLNIIDCNSAFQTQTCSDKEYWLISQEQILPLCREYFTDLELKAIATKNHKLLMEDNK